MRFELSTNRLTLKVLDSSSAKLVLDFQINNKNRFEKYEPHFGNNFYTLDYQEKTMELEYQNIINCKMIRYWIFEKNDFSKIIGTVSLRNMIKPIYASCTVGYKMDKDYCRMGYCYEALSEIIPHAAKYAGMHRFEAFVLPENNPSIGLLEKLGFEKEGLLRDKIIIDNIPRDHYIYSYLTDNSLF